MHDWFLWAKYYLEGINICQNHTNILSLSTCEVCKIKCVNPFYSAQCCVLKLNCGSCKLTESHFWGKPLRLRVLASHLLPEGKQFSLEGKYLCVKGTCCLPCVLIEVKKLRTIRMASNEMSVYILNLETILNLSQKVIE